MITAATCLAMALYYEARGEGPDGMLAVAEVIINRVQHPDFPGTVCEVVKEDRGPEPWDCQFSFYCDGKPERPTDVVAWSTARDIAAQAMDGEVLGHGATYFHATSVHPFWADIFTPVGQVGAHIFYTDETRCVLPLCSPRPTPRPEGLTNG
jgi:spore germination cell wall hydrolase CwlJ-like protein